MASSSPITNCKAQLAAPWSVPGPSETWPLIAKVRLSVPWPNGSDLGLATPSRLVLVQFQPWPLITKVRPRRALVQWVMSCLGQAVPCSPWPVRSRACLLHACSAPCVRSYGRPMPAHVLALLGQVFALRDHAPTSESSCAYGLPTPCSCSCLRPCRLRPVSTYDTLDSLEILLDQTSPV